MFYINGLEWRLKFVPRADPSLTRRDGSVSIGMCDGQSQTIYIDETLRGRRLKKVISHELAHAAMFSYNIILTLEQEEVLADIISTYGEEIIDITDTIFDKLSGMR